MGDNKVLESTRPLVDNAQHVFIKEQEVEHQAWHYSMAELKIPAWDFPVFIEQNDESTIDYFLLGNSLNFAFKDFDTKEKFVVEYGGNDWVGSTGMWACLKRAYDAGVPILEGEYWKDISEDEVREFFAGKNEIPLVADRFEILKEVGTVLAKKYGGHFHNLVSQSNRKLFNNGEGIVERLTSDFPSFDDSVYFDGELVRFDKRAQLAVAMLYGRFRNQGAFQVDDIGELTVFADYVVPNTLRTLGILLYTPELEDRIDSQEIIPRLCQEELEIRAATIHAADRLKNEINKQRKDPVNSLHVDYLLWRAGREGTNPHPHHLTKTTDY